MGGVRKIHSLHPSAPSRFRSPSDLGCVFPSFACLGGLGWLQAQPDQSVAALGWSWAWQWPALRLCSFSAFFITFKCYLPTSSYCNWGFTYLYTCLLHFHYENIYCLLFVAEPKRTLQFHFFLLGPSCFFYFRYGVAQAQPLSSSLHSGFTWGQSSWDPRVTAPTVVSPGLPLPRLAIPFALLLFPGPRSSSMLSHFLILVEHGQK